MNSSYSKYVLASAIALVLGAGSAAAATRTDLHRSDLVGAKQANANIAATAATRTVHARHAKAIGLDNESHLLLLQRKSDRGVRAHRYQQTFRGLPIFGEQVVVAEDLNGDMKTLFGQKISGLASEIPATPVRIDPVRAAEIGKSAGLGPRVGFMRVFNNESKLSIWLDDAGRAHRAYVVTYFADTTLGGMPTRPTLVIDADSGRVLKQWDNLQHALIGTGPGGNQKTGQYEYGTNRGFLDVTQSGSTCSMNNARVKTVNLNGGTSGSTAFSYTCPRNTVKTINGAFSPLNDAHFFGDEIYRMYNAYLGRNPLTFQLVMRVHYSSNYQNAFWNGSSMTFGDGGTTFYPLVSLDVASHEVSHGFTEQNSRLVYSGQSGGMNEAFSDMAGEAAEYFSRGSNDWLVGSEIYKATGALRYMCTPTQDGRSIDNAANFTTGMDVHFSSGVYNKAFCLLAKTSGWNTAQAFRVFARANDLYWTSSSTFNQGACGVRTATTDLGYSVAAVDAAFSAVGVSCGTTPPTGTVVLNITIPSIASKAYSSVYPVSIPTGTTSLVVETSGGSGDADLYVLANGTPTTTTYTCRSNGGTNTEKCTITNPVAGSTYNIRVFGYTTVSNVNLKATRSPN